MLNKSESFKQTPDAKFFKLILLHLSLRIPPLLFAQKKMLPAQGSTKMRRVGKQLLTSTGNYSCLALLLLFHSMIMRPVNIRIDIACLKSINRIMKE